MSSNKIKGLCTKGKKGWTLSSAYLDYRREGGSFSPDVWNNRLKELDREKRREGR